MICRRYLIGMLSLGLGVGIILGGIIPGILLIFLFSAALIALGIALLIR